MRKIDIEKLILLNPDEVLEDFMEEEFTPIDPDELEKSLAPLTKALARYA